MSSAGRSLDGSRPWVMAQAQHGEGRAAAGDDQDACATGEVHRQQDHGDIEHGHGDIERRHGVDDEDGDARGWPPAIGMRSEGGPVSVQLRMSESIRGATRPPYQCTWARHARMNGKVPRRQALYWRHRYCGARGACGRWALFGSRCGFRTRSTCVAALILFLGGIAASGRCGPTSFPRSTSRW